MIKSYPEDVFYKVGDRVQIVSREWPGIEGSWHDLPLGSIGRVVNVDYSKYYERTQYCVQREDRRHSQYVFDFHIIPAEGAKNSHYAQLLSTEY